MLGTPNTRALREAASYVIAQNYGSHQPKFVVIALTA
jgi:hypothetical protein